jgi:hypothetical protein
MKHVGIPGASKLQNKSSTLEPGEHHCSFSSGDSYRCVGFLITSGFYGGYPLMLGLR